MTAAEFIATYGIMMTVTSAPSNPHMTDQKWKADHWVVTIWPDYPRPIVSSMTAYYSTGIGHRKGGKPVAPSLSMVLESLALDASMADQAFSDWCSDLGYDEDSRKALDVYMGCQRIATDLRALLGGKGLDDLRSVEW